MPSLTRLLALPPARPDRRARPQEAEMEEDEEAAPAAPMGQANKILFVEGLPEATTSSMLSMLFKQFPGCASACAKPNWWFRAHSALSHPTSFAEVRMVEAKPGIAFVEFESELQSGVALTGLAGFSITPQHRLSISFAKQ